MNSQHGEYICHTGAVPSVFAERIRDDMALKLRRVDTWVASIEDKPGALAAKLAALKEAGIPIAFVLARRDPDKPGTGVVFVTPVEGPAQCRAARNAGFAKSASIHTVQVEGVNTRGQGTAIAQALADGELNVRGLSTAFWGSKFIAYVALDTRSQARQAVRLLRWL